LGVQEMLDVAMRYGTAMSDAMIGACVRWAHETGAMLSMPDELASRLDRDETHTIPYEDWARLTGASV